MGPGVLRHSGVPHQGPPRRRIQGPQQHRHDKGKEERANLYFRPEGAGPSGDEGEGNLEHIMLIILLNCAHNLGRGTSIQEREHGGPPRLHQRDPRAEGPEGGGAHLALQGDQGGHEPVGGPKLQQGEGSLPEGAWRRQAGNVNILF